MSESTVNRAALATTIALCAAIDGGLFWLVLSSTGSIVSTLWVFIIAGGSATLLISWPMYSWLKKRIGTNAAA